LDGEDFFAMQNGQIDRPEDDVNNDQMDEELQAFEFDESQTIDANQAGPSNRVKLAITLELFNYQFFSHYQTSESMSRNVNSTNTACHFVSLEGMIFTGCGSHASWPSFSSLPLSIGLNAINWTIKRKCRRK
jgi:hypothetical protein